MSDANTMETTEEPTPAEFQPIEESTSQTTDMTLDWLCWETRPKRPLSSASRR
jgi:hypothetical protein